MKRAISLLFLLLPTIALSQELPASQPTSAPTAEPTSAPDSLPSSALSATTKPFGTWDPVHYKRYPRLSYRLSLYPTLVGYAGTLTFASIGFLSENKDLRPLWLSFGTMALVGPSIGHFYSGEYFKGLRLLGRRVAVPGLLAATGTVLLVASGGFTAFSAFDGNKDGVSRGALYGLLVSSALISYSIPSITIMSGRHIRDAKKSPIREAKDHNLAAPPFERPKAKK